MRERYSETEDQIVRVLEPTCVASSHQRVAISVERTCLVQGVELFIRRTAHWFKIKYSSANYDFFVNDIYPTKIFLFLFCLRALLNTPCLYHFNPSSTSYAQRTAADKSLVWRQEGYDEAFRSGFPGDPAWIQFALFRFFSLPSFIIIFIAITTNLLSRLTHYHNHYYLHSFINMANAVQMLTPTLTNSTTSEEHRNAEEKTNAKRAQMNAYLAKPIDPEFAAVDKWCDSALKLSTQAERLESEEVKFIQAREILDRRGREIVTAHELGVKLLLDVVHALKGITEDDLSLRVSVLSISSPCAIVLTC